MLFRKTDLQTPEYVKKTPAQWVYVINCHQLKE